MRQGRMWRIRASSLAAAACLVTATLVAAPPASAGIYEPVVLPLDDVYQMLLDDASGQIYVSEGADGNDVVVLDLDGELIGTIGNLAGPTGLALSEDGSIVWVSLRYGDAAVGYSTTTLAEVDRVNLPAGTCPLYLAETASKLVVDPGCGDTDLVIVDLAGDRTPLSVEQFGLGGTLLASPANPGVVICGNSIQLNVLDVTGATPQVVVSRSGAGSGDMALDPTGTRLLISGPGHGASVLDVDDLRSLEFYPTGEDGPGSVDWSGDGSTIAAATGGYGGMITFDVGVTTPSWQYTIFGYKQPKRGIAISVDGSLFYALTNNTSAPVELHIRTVGTNPASIHGRLMAFDGTSARLGHVELYEDGSLITEMDVTGGEFRLDNIEPGTYYMFSWNGDDIYFWDYFPRWWRDSPMFRPDRATPIVVQSGTDVTGIDIYLPALYYDMFDSVFGNDIFWLGNSGITRGCNPPDNTLFCVDQPVTRGQMAAFLDRALGLPNVEVPGFVDDDGSMFEAPIERLAAAGITKGCNPPENTMFCPDDIVTRGQMAAFMVRALGLSERVPVGFVDDDSSVFEVSIEKLAAAGITKGCNPPENTMFCPEDPVTRGQMAAFLARAVGT